jgi:hypothetical protein
MRLLHLGDVVSITDDKQGFKDIHGVVLYHNTENCQIAFRIIANEYVGKTTYITHRNNVKNILGHYDGNIF